MNALQKGHQHEEMLSVTKVPLVLGMTISGMTTNEQTRVMTTDMYFSTGRACFYDNSTMFGMTTNYYAMYLVLKTGHIDEAVYAG